MIQKHFVLHCLYNAAYVHRASCLHCTRLPISMSTQRHRPQFLGRSPVQERDYPPPALADDRVGPIAEGVPELIAALAVLIAFCTCRAERRHKRGLTMCRTGQIACTYDHRSAICLDLLLCASTSLNQLQPLRNCHWPSNDDYFGHWPPADRLPIGCNAASS